MASHFGAAAMHALTLPLLSHSTQSANNLSRYCRTFGGAGVVQFVGIQGATYGHTGHGGLLT